MRRLPVYFLIDISESMVGEPILQVQEGLAAIVQALKTDPHALETVWVSIIVFAGQARTLVPLQELVAFYPPKFPVGSGTSLSKGLVHLMAELKRNVVKTTFEQKGDWKPIVFLFTDGAPTDDASAAIAAWRQQWQRTANMIAVSFGNAADTQSLGELTENVLAFKNADQLAYKQFFKWVTDSIKTSSESVENNAAFELPKLDGNTLSKIDLTKHTGPRQYVDNNFVVLAARCAQSRRPYLIKYHKVISPSVIGGFETLSYQLSGAYQVDNAYFELSDSAAAKQKINSEELSGVPACPYCANMYGFAMCSCGSVHCISGAGKGECPWCGTVNIYGAGNEGFDVNRTQG